jgi:hypothetical protein
LKIKSQGKYIISLSNINSVRRESECITINGMLSFLIILLIAAGLGVTYGVSRRNKPTPAFVSNSKSFPENRFKEEIAMEKETKIIKERVKSAETAQIKKVAAAKAEEEIAEELVPLKDQLKEIQSTLSNLGTNGQQQNNMNSSTGQNQQQPNQLLQQMQDFSSQARQQQQKTFQQLQQSVHQTAQMLTNVEQSLQSINMLNQITQQINQSQQSLQQQMQGQSQQGQQQSGQQNFNNQSYQ